MTREEAIKALERAEDYAGIQCVNNCVDAYISPYLLKAIDFAVAALREQEQRRWIPVTERLPDKPMRCLVYTKRGEYGGYEITYYNQGFYTQYAEVTHWMQLPELPQPPKGE